MGQREKDILRQMRDRGTTMQEKDLELILNSAGAVETLKTKGFFMLYYSGTGGALLNGDTFTIGPVVYEFQDVPGTEAMGNIFVDRTPAAGDDGQAVIDAINGAQGDVVLATYDQSDVSAQIEALTDEAAAFVVSDTLTGALNEIKPAIFSSIELQKISYTITIPANIAPAPGVFSVPVPATWNKVRAVQVQQFSTFGGTEGQTGFGDNSTSIGAWDLLTGGGFRAVEISVGTPAFVAGDLLLVELWGHA